MAEGPSPLILAWGWAVFALTVGTVFLFVWHVNRLDIPDWSRHPERWRHETRYAIQPLALGFFCSRPSCGVFNGDGKEFRLMCRSCEAPRPIVGGRWVRL